MEIPRQFMSYVKIHNIVPGEKGKMEQKEEQFVVSEDDLKEDEQLYPQLEAHESNYNYGGDLYANAPLPSGWEKGYDESGRPYYLDNVRKITQWEHPSSTKKQYLFVVFSCVLIYL
eukprot:217851_1